MSDLDPNPRESSCGGVAVAEASPEPETLLPREVPLGGPKGILVRRTIPHRVIRTVGAWCFADHYGPVDLTAPGARGMLVPPHPHTGLQTVTWLLEGTVEHRDSVGSHQLVRPGELSLMTAGHGIAHSEYSTAQASTLFGAQLWVALTEDHRAQQPHFEHHDDLPGIELDGVRATIILGSFAGSTSPARTYSPLVGVEVEIPQGSAAALPLEPDFEHALLVVRGEAEVDGEPVPFGGLRYLGWGADAVSVASRPGATLLLLGGEPLAERLLMWWNFVGRNHDEIVEARRAWEAGERFGAVAGDDRPPLPAPPIPNARMMPRSSR